MTKPSPNTFAGADDSDLRFAARELEAARIELLAAHAVVDKRERREAIRSAISKLALASRTINDVVHRRGGVDA